MTVSEVDGSRSGWLKLNSSEGTPNRSNKEGSDNIVKVNATKHTGHKNALIIMCLVGARFYRVTLSF